MMNHCETSWVLYFIFEDRIDGGNPPLKSIILCLIGTRAYVYHYKFGEIMLSEPESFRCYLIYQMLNGGN